MDLDLAHVRAFVCTAEELHFGRAAARLFLTQQAVSKRLQRLEATLGEPLLLRDHQAVALTDAGRRFLPHARALLSLADTAIAATRAPVMPLRVDVWGPVHVPLRIMRQLALGELIFELSMRRGLDSALAAVERGELDVAFGRPHDLGRPWPAGVSRQLFFLEPVAAAVVNGHPLADRPVLTSAELRQTGLWLPFTDKPSELVGLLKAFANHLGVPVEASPLNVGVEHTLDELRRHPHRVTPVGAQWTLPPDITVIPLSPAPFLPWSAVWRDDNRHPGLPHLVELLAKASAQGDWLAFDPATDWLPPPDRDDLPT
ncbi:LysR family transcriptional regulator [Allorhizocola rhizosphaerae]|uniref:LysR family transcriptional regulator n=1 Tax=Allorhizocola rhizosphaerae TaxID=1872709 RepID=UPI000E3CD6FC|nr:LysR family transcriptional regulator [Allorhizocola rhizosphaerae]